VVPEVPESRYEIIFQHIVIAPRYLLLSITCQNTIQ
jgi:hypothetical protein